MSLLHAVLLGIIQGITEFLPISSDGHLVLADVLLDLPLEGKDALGFDILLHAGSLLALLVGYAAVWRDLIVKCLRGDRSGWRVVLLLVIATIPGVIAGLLLEDAISEMRSLRAAGLGFLLTAFLLIVGEYFGRRRTSAVTTVKEITPLQAFLIGLEQAAAILPGLSRSGSTVAIGRLLGLPRSLALDFSFLMAVPIIGGAVAKTLVDALTGDVVFPPPTVSVTGFVTAFIVSMGAISFLRIFVVRRSLAIFAWYLIPVGLIALLVS